MPDEVNTTDQAAALPFTVPAGALAIGVALVQSGEEGDASEVCGLGVCISPHDGAVFVLADPEPDPVGAEEIERMAAFLIGVAGSLRQKAAARAAANVAVAAAVKAGARPPDRPRTGSMHIVNEEMA